MGLMIGCKDTISIGMLTIMLRNGLKRVITAMEIVNK
jgi:hypothetical protein